MRQYYIKKHQQGVVMLLTLVFMIGILGMVGLGIDTGHIFVNKTRLQNALDAAALSAATTLHGTINNTDTDAINDGIATFELFKASAGNSELANISLTAANFSFSELLHPFVAGSTSNYVRVIYNALPVTSIFVQVFTRRSAENVGAVATSGALGQNCGIIPMVLCEKDNIPGGVINIGDNDCSNDNDGDGNNDCFGYNIGPEIVIHERNTKCASTDQVCIDTNLETGHFQLLSAGDSNSGNDIRNSIAGEFDACAANSTDLDLAPGVKQGPVIQGINIRFNKDTVHSEYFTDHAVGSIGDTGTYKDDQVNSIDYPKDEGGVENERIVVMPVGNCEGIQSGETHIAHVPGESNPDVALMCLLIKREGDMPSKSLYFELIESCDGLGFNPVDSIISGPIKIVLFKSWQSGDS